MQDFLVLGIIPGTNVQVSFETYAVIIGVFACVLFLGALFLKRAQQSSFGFNATDWYIETPISQHEAPVDTNTQQLVVIRPDQMVEGFARTAAAPQADIAAQA